ncbi:unnamed protein product [Echinostoma caproni]|uniref:Hexosyltransferase n=1 Tax=Echinostoma caproni TaxID=27848 RepID=A0A183AJ67_9TREM|nr:unnamed protein product [Echinostoma caproni]
MLSVSAIVKDLAGDLVAGQLDMTTTQTAKISSMFVRSTEGEENAVRDLRESWIFTRGESVQMEKTNFWKIPWLLRSKLHWIYYIASAAIFITLTVFVYRYINNYYAVTEIIYNYPLDIDLHQIYEKLDPTAIRISPCEINPANFRLIHDPKSFCKTVHPFLPKYKDIHGHPDLLIIVKSSPESFDQRNAIRQTWANATCVSYLDTSTRTVFALGSTARPQTSLIERLRWEHDTFGDLLQFDFVDSYHNNTYKMMSVLRHISRNCRATRFVVLVDDDFLVHPSNLIRAIQRITTTQYPTYVSGAVFSVQRPDRRPWSESYVPYSVYPYLLYLPYPAGGTVILSMPVVRLLAVGMRFVKFLWIDDVFLGIVLHKLGISPQRLRGVYVQRSPSDSELSGVISMHGFSSAQKMRKGWDKLMRVNACSQLDRKAKGTF